MTLALVFCAVFFLAALGLLWRAWKSGEPWEEISACSCPVLMLRRQDGDGYRFKAFHWKTCTARSKA